MDRLTPAAKELLGEYRRGRPGTGGAARNYQALVGQIRRARPQSEPPFEPKPGADWKRQLGWGLASAAAAVVLLFVVDALLPEATTVSPGGGLAPNEAVDGTAQGQGGSVVRPRSPKVTRKPPPVEASPVASEAAGVVPVRPAPKRTAAQAEVAGPDALAEETRLLKATREALRRGDLSAARVALDEHGRRFPKGALAEDRAAYDVIVRCRGAEASATERRAAFGRAYPRSPHAPRIDEACGGKR